MNRSSRPLPPHDQTNGHAERPWMDLATFNRVFFYLIADGQEARAQNLLDTFKIGNDGAHAKIQIHVGNDSRSEAT